MYIPSAFAETDSDRLFDFIEAHSFGLLVSHTGGQLQATHLPLLLAREAGARGRLVGHIARANPHWRSIGGAEVMCVFSGPHAYVSPTWYEAVDVVPTWNYVAVHVYGTCRIVEDPEATAQIVADYVTHYERSMPRPWQLDRTTPFFQKLIKAVVAFEVDIRRIEGKWKLGQNHSADRRRKAAEQLAERDDQDAREIARLMRESLS